MEYFTIKDAKTGQQTAVRFIGAVDAQTGEPPACPDLVGQGTPAGRLLMRHLARGQAEDAARVIGDTGYGMRDELAWYDAQTLGRLADRPDAVPADITRGGDVLWPGVRVYVRQGIAYVRARGQVHLFGVCPDHA